MFFLKLITEEELAEVIREVFLKPISTRSESQNNNANAEEVNTQFKLEKRK